MAGKGRVCAGDQSSVEEQEHETRQAGWTSKTSKLECVGINRAQHGVGSGLRFLMMPLGALGLI